jgi:hypothetical protein
MRFRQMLFSLAGFAVLFAGVAWLDPRVRDKFAQLLHAGDGIASWDNRAVDLAGAVVAAIRYQSIDNGVIMLFAAVGAVLVVFMVRT